MHIYHPHRNHRFVPILCVAAGIPIVLVGLWLWGGAVFTHDVPAPDDRDLILPAVSVAESDNGFAKLQTLSDHVAASFPDTTPPMNDERAIAMLNGGDWDQAYAATSTSKYRNDIDAFVSLHSFAYILDPDAADPAKITPTTFPFKNIGFVRYLAQLSALDALNQAHNGRVQAGLDQAIALVRIGHLLESGNVFVIEYLIGSIVKQTGLTTLRQIALSSAITPEQSIATAKNIRQYRDSTLGALNALKLEHSVRANYQQSINSIEGVWASFYEASVVDSSTTYPHPSFTRYIVRVIDRSGALQFYYRPNQAWQMAVDRDRKNIAEAGASCTQVTRLETVEPILKQHGWALLLEPNAIAKVIYDIGNISFSGFTMRRCDEAMAEAVTEVTLGISAYQQEKKQFPAALSDLLTTHLDTLPLDPYSGAALRYLPNERRVYSVGINHLDEGGDRTLEKDSYVNSAIPWQWMKDPTFAIVQ
jgi:hypothetical protein